MLFRRVGFDVVVGLVVGLFGRANSGTGAAFEVSDEVKMSLRCLSCVVVCVLRGGSNVLTSAF